MGVCGGGVGVFDTAAGDRLVGGGAGEAADLSNILTAPLVGSLISILIPFRDGIWKLVDLGAGLFAARGVVAAWLTAGVIGVCGPIFEAGLSEIADEVRDIEGGCCGAPY